MGFWDSLSESATNSYNNTYNNLTMSNMLDKLQKQQQQGMQDKYLPNQVSNNTVAGIGNKLLDTRGQWDTTNKNLQGATDPALTQQYQDQLAQIEGQGLTLRNSLKDLLTGNPNLGGMLAMIPNRNFGADMSTQTISDLVNRASQNSFYNSKLTDIDLRGIQGIRR